MTLTARRYQQNSCRASDDELRRVFGEGKPDVTEHIIRVLHKAKVLGGKITGSYKDDEVRDDKAE